MRFDPASRSRVTWRDLDRFPSSSLFDRIGRAVAAAGCLPRKELFEAWEVARRVRRSCRGGHLIDLAGGHGLAAQILLLIDDSSPDALVVDSVVPPCAAAVHEALVAVWPRLAGRVQFRQQLIAEVPLVATDLVVSIHACGALSDTVLTRAADARARVAVLPCCHDLDAGQARPLDGWMDRALAVDVRRALALEARGYLVRTLTIPAAITPKNRLLVGVPREAAGMAD